MAGNNRGSSKGGFIIGAIIGALAGVLLAPRPGADIRSSLVERSEPWRARAREVGYKATDRFGPRIRSRLEPIAGRFNSRFRRGAMVSDSNGPTAEVEAAAVVVTDGDEGPKS